MERDMIVEVSNRKWYNVRDASYVISKSDILVDENEKTEPPDPRRENPIFTIWVHTGYAVLILSVIAWMVYMEFFM